MARADMLSERERLVTERMFANVVRVLGHMEYYVDCLYILETAKFIAPHSLFYNLYFIHSPIRKPTIPFAL